PAVAGVWTPEPLKPVTGSLKVTLKWIGELRVGSACVAAFTIDAVGAVASTVQVYETASPTLPALSTARTWKVCEPSVTGKLCGLVQVAKEPEASLHSRWLTPEETPPEDRKSTRLNSSDQIISY